MSKLFTIYRCDGPNGVEGRPCAALVTLPTNRTLASFGWRFSLDPPKHFCPGCRDTAEAKAYLNPPPASPEPPVQIS